MANIKLLHNVTHEGILLKEGMIVSDADHGLSSVAQSLIERKLAEVTQDSATHTASVVNTASEAMPISNAAAGQKPNADADAERKAQAQANQTPADKQTQNEVINQANKEDKVSFKDRILGSNKQQPNDPAPLNPSPEEIAAAAASQN